MRRFAFAAAAFALAASAAMPASADDVTIGALKISAPWARATPKGAAVGGGYLTIANTGTAPDRLVSGVTDVARSFELHEMRLDQGVMKMRELSQGLEIRPGETVAFKPGGYHVMLVGLKQQLVQGESFKATLQFEKAGKVEVSFAIAGIGAQSAGTQSPNAQAPVAAGDHSGGIKH